MLSNEAVWPTLARGFVSLRMDWEQGNHYRNRYGFVLGTGDQLLLHPDGTLIPPAGGKQVYGRHGEDMTTPVLARARQATKAQGEIQTLQLEWFLWPRKASAQREGGFYPPPIESAAQYARLPVVEIDGALPSALQDSAFLRRHLRQFIWKRGDANRASRIRIWRVRDGLPDHLPTELAILLGEQLKADPLGKALDEAWLSYMKDRPLTARGYLENPHGGWMRRVAPQMLEEDASMRKSARDGELMPPGRPLP